MNIQICCPDCDSIAVRRSRREKKQSGATSALEKIRYVCAVEERDGECVSLALCTQIPSFPSLFFLILHPLPPPPPPPPPPLLLPPPTPGAVVKLECMRRLSWRPLGLCLITWTRMNMLGLCKSVRRRDSFWTMVGGVSVTTPQTPLVAALTKLSYISSMHCDTAGYMVMLLLMCLCVQMEGTVNMGGRYLMRRLTQCQRASGEKEQRNQYVSV